MKTPQISFYKSGYEEISINQNEGKLIQTNIPPGDEAPPALNKEVNVENNNQLNNMNNTKKIKIIPLKLSTLLILILFLFFVQKEKPKFIIGLYFGTSSSGYYIIKDNNTDSNIYGLSSSELIFDLENKKGFKYGDKAHEYIKKDLENEKKLYFSSFKKYLSDKNLEYNTTIKSDYPLGYEISLKTVISEYLSLFKKNNIDIHLNIINTKEYDIKWVLTVPGLWDDKEKEFMENITNEIGIANVEIILEQEASSLTMLYDNNINKKYLHENENFILIDLGSSSVDICVNKIIKNNNLKQLLQPSSFRYGSNQINSKIIEIIEFVWGKEKINEFKNMNFDGWQTTLDDIEKKKKKLIIIMKEILQF